MISIVCIICNLYTQMDLSSFLCNLTGFLLIIITIYNSLFRINLYINIYLLYYINLVINLDKKFFSYWASKKNSICEQRKTSKTKYHAVQGWVHGFRVLALKALKGEQGEKSPLSPWLRKRDFSPRGGGARAMELRRRGGRGAEPLRSLMSERR